MNYKSRLLIAPQQRLGIVVLMNMNSVNVNSGLFELHQGVLRLLLGQQPLEVKQRHFIPTFPGMIGIFIISLLIGFGIVGSLIRPPARQTNPPGMQLSIWNVLKPVLPQLALSVVWPLLLLLGVPKATGRSLSFLLLYIPDLGYLLIVSALLAPIWLAVRIWKVYRQSQRPSISAGSRHEPLA